VCVHVGEWDEVTHDHKMGTFSVQKFVVHRYDAQKCREFSYIILQ
jgi:hypothetical protein